VGFDSKFEGRVSYSLKVCGAKFEHKPIKIPYIIESTYTPDFVIKKKITKDIYIEAKGYLRPEHRKKMICVKEQNLDLDIRFVFQNPNQKLSNRIKSITYAKWAERNGFKWARSIVPQSWIDE